MAYRKTPRASAARPTLRGAASVTPQGEAPPAWVAPPGAATIWLGPGGDVCLGLGPSPGHAAGHTVTLNSSDEALLGRLLLSLLRDRANAPKAKLATSAAPTQYMLDCYAEALARGSKVTHALARLEDLDDCFDNPQHF